MFAAVFYLFDVALLLLDEIQIETWRIFTGCACRGMHPKFLLRKRQLKREYTHHCK